MSYPTTILICGGRHFGKKDGEKALLYRTLDALNHGNLTIIHGGAPGADSLAEDWALLGLPREHVYHADWVTHGNAAGPIRNQKMLDEGKPDLVIAFPGGRGTEDMVRRARKAGVPVLRVEP